MTLNRGRLYVVAAAALWSLSGVLAKTIELPGPTMACLRALFAAAVLLPLLRPRLISIRPAMLGMVVCFTTMNVCYVTAITKTTAANAIFLQYTAPAWMFLASVLWLREPFDRRSLQSLALSMMGVAVIVAGNWSGASVGIVLGLVAGLAFGGVAVFLRLLREENSVWLTVLNHSVAGLVLLPFVLSQTELHPRHATSTQLAALAIFGAVQMALPYILFSRGLSVVSAQEAGVVALLEPTLNPLLTYLAVGEVPTASTLAGGAIILAAVAWRYLRPGLDRATATETESGGRVAANEPSG